MPTTVQECLSNKENPEESSENLQNSRKYNFEGKIKGFHAQTKNKSSFQMGGR